LKERRFSRQMVAVCLVLASALTLTNAVVQPVASQAYLTTTNTETFFTVGYTTSSFDVTIFVVQYRSSTSLLTIIDVQYTTLTSFITHIDVEPPINSPAPPLHTQDPPRNSFSNHYRPRIQSALPSTFDESFNGQVSVGSMLASLAFCLTLLATVMLVRRLKK
jgi:hypothetical protein